MKAGLFSYPTHFTPPTPDAEDGLSFLRLVRSRQVGPRTFRRLLAEQGDAETALACLPKIARAAGLRDYTPCSAAAAKKEIAAGRRAGARLLLLGYAGYPPALADLDDAPPVLWALGDGAQAERPAIALVGARNASSLGLRMARRLAREIGEAGYVVVSGLARGIDAAAHEASLPTGTVAVQAGGIDVLYPAENAALARDIGARGLRLSEMPPGFAPRARHFPQRNRIIAGLGRATVVVEAAERSGSIVTARIALDRGREVMAVPGHPIDPRAAGCNALIRDGAALIRSAADIIELLGPAETGTFSPPPGPVLPGRIPPGQETGPETAAPPDSASEPDLRPIGDPRSLRDRLFSALGPAPVEEETLQRDTGIAPRRLAELLLKLELSGRVRRHPGGRIGIA